MTFDRVHSRVTAVAILVLTIHRVSLSVVLFPSCPNALQQDECAAAEGGAAGNVTVAVFRRPKSPRRACWPF